MILPEFLFKMPMATFTLLVIARLHYYYNEGCSNEELCEVFRRRRWQWFIRSSCFTENAAEGPLARCAATLRWRSKRAAAPRPRPSRDAV